MGDARGPVVVGLYLSAVFRNLMSDQTMACRRGDRDRPVAESAWCVVFRGQDARGPARLWAGIGFRSQSTCRGGINVGCRSAPITISQSLWWSRR